GGKPPHGHARFPGARKARRPVRGHHGDPSRHGCAIERGGGLVVDNDGSARGLQDTREETDHRRLPRRVRPDQPEHLARLEREAQPAQLKGRPAAGAMRIGEAHVAEFREGGHGATLATRERRSQMNTGAPQKAVSTPTESSAGATTRRARGSGARGKAPPPSRAPGTSTRLSGPSSIRRAWGTMRPTKPIGPTNATTVPVRRAAPRKMRRLRPRASTPSSVAPSSPRARRFRARAWPSTS